MPRKATPNSRPSPGDSGEPLARRRLKGHHARIMTAGAAAAVATIVPKILLAAQPSRPPAPADAIILPALAEYRPGDTLQSGSPMEGSRSSNDDSLPPNPFPPRVVYWRFVDADAHTLAASHGYVSIGYAGGDFLAQLGDFDEARPLVLHAAYGITDDFTLAIGSGVWDYDFESGGGAHTDYFPYVAPKLRVLTSGNMTASVGGRLVFPTAEGSEGQSYGFAVALSATGEGHSGHLTLGFHGNRDSDESETDYAIGIGGDVVAPLGTDNEFKLFGEMRLLGVENENVEVLTVGTRFLGGSGLGAELGFALWFGFEQDSRTRPVVSLSYRF